MAITRFRLEGDSDTKEGVIEELGSKAVEIMKLVRQVPSVCGKWECTDDVTSANKIHHNGKPPTIDGYYGRMNFVFKIYNNGEHNWDEGYMQRICRTCGRVEAT